MTEKGIREYGLSESKRFVIEEYGIWDYGKKLSWLELCRVLNELDTMANTDLNEYELITRLQNENEELKQKLEDIKYSIDNVRQYLKTIDLIVEEADSIEIIGNGNKKELKE